MLPKMFRITRTVLPRVFFSGLFVFALLGFGLLVAFILASTYLLGLGGAALAGRDPMWLETFGIGVVILFTGFILLKLANR